jgi:subtilisin family serine protease
VLIFIIDAGSGDCNDPTVLDSATADECEPVSLTSGCLSAGTYWLWVGPSSFYDLPCDGVNNDYVATLTCDTCCILECPPDANQETEPCGDDTNGGCNMDEPNFEPISCGDTVCGTAWYDGSTRDTDWYEIVTTEPIVLAWEVIAEFDVVIGLVETTVPGSGDCNDSTGYLSPYDAAGACGLASITTSCLPPGTYWLFVAPDFYAQSFDCNSNSKDYIATLTCEPCPTGACCLLDGSCIPNQIDYECAAIEGFWQGPDTTCDPNPCHQPEPGDNCIIPLELTLGPNDSPYTDINYTCGRYDYYDDTCLGYYDGGEDIIYKLTVTSAMDVDIILDPCGTSWTGIAIGDMCPLERCIGYSTSGSSSEPHGIVCVHLDQGVYYIMIDTWPSPDCIEQFVLTIEQCVPDISIEPDQLNFDCYGAYSGESTSDDMSGTQTGTKSHMKANRGGSASGSQPRRLGGDVSMPQRIYSPAEKLIDADRIMRAFESGRDDVDVIVNLVRPAEVFATTSFRDVGSRRALRREVAGRQDTVLSALKSGEFGLKYRYENLAAFSGAVTRKALEKLMNNPAVASIEPVRILHAHLAQGVPLMNALDYRSTYNGQGMAIAICDTGIDYNHPMLGNGGFPNGKVIGGYDFGDDDADPFPCEPHGTACAGLAAGDLGSVGDYIGGVAHNARLYALKISYGCSGSAYTDAMVAAWDWCVSHQYDDPCNPIMAISTSFGGGRFFNAGSCDIDTPAMTVAAENAVAAGITVLASAGNDGWCESMGWPACISSVISVGAVYDAAFGTYYPCVDEDSCATKYASSGCPSGWYAIDNTAADMVTSYSNSATFLDQLAPSNRAYTTDIVGSEGYSSGDYTSSFGGTSAASPYTAGTVACLQQAAKALTGSYLTPQQVRSTLAATGDAFADGKIPSIIKPRVNLGNAIDSLSPCPGQTMTIYNDGGGTLEVTAIDRPAWVSLLPLPPYSIPAGGSREVCVVVDCNSPAANAGYDLARLLTIYSNDPDENPYPDGVYIRVDCPSCGPVGDLDNDCDEDMLDYSIFALHWQETGCDIADWCDGADLTQNGQVDMYDLAAFVEEWLYGTGP